MFFIHVYVALYWVTYLRRGLLKEPEQGFLF